MDRGADGTAPTPDTPDRFAELAARVQEHFPAVTLDRTPASLDGLDAALAGPRRPDRPEDADPVATVGSYLGETLVASADAAWVETEPGHWAVVVYGDGPVTVNVFAVARDALRDPPALARAYETAVETAGE